MSSLTVIGDVHGKFTQYKRILDKHENTVQVGDMGVGFYHPSGLASQNPPYDKMVAGGHRFIRGNHDNPSVCLNHSQWIPDGFVDNDIMFVGGALSVDRQWRTEGFDYWENEELSTPELHEIMDLYLAVKPRIMITHETTETVAEFLTSLSGRKKLDFPSRTRQAFQSMFELHQPDLWIHGHWHISCDHVLEGTRFVCLNELETRTFDV